MQTSPLPSRREFLRRTVAGAVAAWGSSSFFALASEAKTAVAVRPTPVSLTTGSDRATMVFEGLKPFAAEVKAAIGSRRVVIKPNNVGIDNQLCATHAGQLEGILEFLKSIGKAGQAVIAESAASGPTLDGFDNYKYPPLASKYGVKLLDLDQEPVEVVQVFDEKDFRPHPVRMSSVLMDPNAYIISAAKMKTHDRVVATLSLKNIIFGAPIKDLGFRWGRDSKAGARNDKPIAHGSGFRGINYNLFAIAQRLHPQLSVIDGYQGMEGNGPVGGTPVEHRVCVVATDWLAADRVGVELMGIDYANVGYLNYCAQAKLGEGDLSRLEILGPPLSRHIRPYRLSENIAEQLVWRQKAGA